MARHLDFVFRKLVNDWKSLRITELHFKEPYGFLLIIDSGAGASVKEERPTGSRQKEVLYREIYMLNLHQSSIPNCNAGLDKTSPKRCWVNCVLRDQ
jgi:hypothetical protein